MASKVVPGGKGSGVDDVADVEDAPTKVPATQASTVFETPDEQSARIAGMGKGVGKGVEDAYKVDGLDEAEDAVVPELFPGERLVANCPLVFDASTEITPSLADYNYVALGVATADLAKVMSIADAISKKGGSAISCSPILQKSNVGFADANAAFFALPAAAMAEVGALLEQEGVCFHAEGRGVYGTLSGAGVVFDGPGLESVRQVLVSGTVNTQEKIATTASFDMALRSICPRPPEPTAFAKIDIDPLDMGYQKPGMHKGFVSEFDLNDANFTSFMSSSSKKADFIQTLTKMAANKKCCLDVAALNDGKVRVLALREDPYDLFEVAVQIYGYLKSLDIHFLSAKMLSTNMGTASLAGVQGPFFHGGYLRDLAKLKGARGLIELGPGMEKYDSTVDKRHPWLQLGVTKVPGKKHEESRYYVQKLQVLRESDEVLGAMQLREFLGRELEMEQMQEIFKKADEEGLQFALVSGAAGVGKSSLTAQAFQAQKGAALALVFCREVDDMNEVRTLVKSWIQESELLVSTGKVRVAEDVNRALAYLNRFLSQKESKGFNEDYLVAAMLIVLQFLVRNGKKINVLFDDIDAAGLSSARILQSLFDKLNTGKADLKGVSVFATKRSDQTHAKGDMAGIVDGWIDGYFSQNEVKVNEWELVKYDASRVPTIFADLPKYIGMRSLGKQVQIADDHLIRLVDILKHYGSVGSNETIATADKVTISPFVLRVAVDTLFDLGVISIVNDQVIVNETEGTALPMNIQNVYEYQFGRLSQDHKQVLSVALLLKGMEYSVLEKVIGALGLNSSLLFDLRDKRSILNQGSVVDMHSLWSPLISQHVNSVENATLKTNVLNALNDVRGTEGVSSLRIFDLANEAKRADLIANVAFDAISEAIRTHQYDRAIKLTATGSNMRDLLANHPYVVVAPDPESKELITVNLYNQVRFLRAKALVYSGRDLQEASKVVNSLRVDDLPDSMRFEFSALEMELGRMLVTSIEKGGNVADLHTGLRAYNKNINNVRGWLSTRTASPNVAFMDVMTDYHALRADYFKAGLALKERGDKNTVIGMYGEITNKTVGMVKNLATLKQAAGLSGLSEHDIQVLIADVLNLRASSEMQMLRRKHDMQEEGIVRDVANATTPAAAVTSRMLADVKRSADSILLLSRQVGGLRGDLVAETRAAQLACAADAMSGVDMAVLERDLQRFLSFVREVNPQDGGACLSNVGNAVSTVLMADVRLNEDTTKEGKLVEMYDVLTRQAVAVGGEDLYSLFNRIESMLMSMVFDRNGGVVSGEVDALVTKLTSGSIEIPSGYEAALASLLDKVGAVKRGDFATLSAMYNRV